MLGPDDALDALPSGLRDPLIDEYRTIVTSFMEHRWSAAELSAGRFCEIVYTVLAGHAAGTYASSPYKPANFVEACRRLEANTGVPRSFRILIPRLLPALYEIRNNRNVGHVGGDVNPDSMDSSAVMAIASWVLAELVRVFHGLSTEEAQRLVDSLTERRIPIVWTSRGRRRVLDPNMSLKDQILVLVASCGGTAKADELYLWTGYDKRGYFNRVVRMLHVSRFVEYDEAAGDVELLPPGNEYACLLLAE